jgi:hypothetical protein
LVHANEVRGVQDTVRPSQFSYLLLASGHKIEVRHTVKTVLDGLCYLTRNLRPVTDPTQAVEDYAILEPFRWSRPIPIEVLAKNWAAHEETMRKGADTPAARMMKMPIKVNVDPGNGEDLGPKKRGEPGHGKPDLPSHLTSPPTTTPETLPTSASSETGATAASGVPSAGDTPPPASSGPTSPSE